MVFIRDSSRRCGWLVLDQQMGTNDFKEKGELTATSTDSDRARQPAGAVVSRGGSAVLFPMEGAEEGL